MIVMTPTAKAWVAGVLDSSGSMLVMRTRRPNGVAYTIRVEVAHKDPKLIVKICDLTGVGTVRMRFPNAPVWFWKVDTVDGVQELLRAVRPLLSIKAAQADVMLHLPAKNVREPAVREAIWKQMAALNGKRIAA